MACGLAPTPNCLVTVIVVGLGIVPSVELRELEEQILLQDPALAASPRRVVLHNLPVPATPLIGREEALEAALVKPASTRGPPHQWRTPGPVAQEPARGPRAGLAGCGGRGPAALGDRADRQHDEEQHDRHHCHGCRARGVGVVADDESDCHREDSDE